MADEVFGRASRLIRPFRADELILSGSDGRLTVDPQRSAQFDVARHEQNAVQDTQQIPAEHRSSAESDHATQHDGTITITSADSLTTSLDAARNAIRESLNSDHLPHATQDVATSDHAAEHTAQHTTSAPEPSSLAEPITSVASSFASAAGHGPLSTVTSEVVASVTNDVGHLLDTVDQTVHSALLDVGKAVENVTHTLLDTVSTVSAGNAVFGLVSNTVSGVTDAAVTVASLDGAGRDALSGLIHPPASVTSEVISTASEVIDHTLLSVPIGLDHIHQPDLGINEMQHAAHAHIGTGLI